MTMLQKIDFEDDFQDLQDDRGHLLRPSYYWTIFKKRWPYFVLPFLLIASAGVAGRVPLAADLSV
jgi:hypothetical protein